jgi:hypothetical protein
LALWFPYEGESQAAWIGTASNDETRARWYQDMNRRDARLVFAVRDILRVIGGN